MQHKHHDLIVAWAKGAKIQCESNPLGSWVDDEHPRWYTNILYRLKPEPKPDIIRSYSVWFDESKNMALWHLLDNTLMLIFDGETGKLKDAQVLVSSGE